MDGIEQVLQPFHPAFAGQAESVEKVSGNDAGIVGEGIDEAFPVIQLIGAGVQVQVTQVEQSERPPEWHFVGGKSMGFRLCLPAMTFGARSIPLQKEEG
jgi:hypothetical protein